LRRLGLISMLVDPASILVVSSSSFGKFFLKLLCSPMTAAVMAVDNDMG
jgi:hypothetical protein